MCAVCQSVPGCKNNAPTHSCLVSEGRDWIWIWGECMEFCVLPSEIKCKEWPCPWCCPSDQSSIYLRRQTVWLQVKLYYMPTLLWGGCQLRLSLLTYEVQRMCWCQITHFFITFQTLVMSEATLWCYIFVRCGTERVIESSISHSTYTTGGGCVVVVWNVSHCSSGQISPVCSLWESPVGCGRN